MNIVETLQTGLSALAPTIAAVLGVVLFLSVANRFFERRRVRTGNPRVMSQFAVALLAFLGLLLIILALPVSETTRGQLYSLLGIVISASIALSSSTIVGNAMGGLLIRFVAGSRVRLGDYIRVEEHAGRVTEMGIFNTQIQTETRDLTWLPNLWLVNRPATLRQSSGTIVNTTVNLGYEADRSTVRAAMLEAAGQIGLRKPFVRIEELGDFSVTYKVGGLLTDLKRLWGTHSGLRAGVLDALHAAGVEVLSPTFMIARQHPPEKVFIPTPSATRAVDETTSEDEIMFDQAAAAAELDSQRQAVRAEYEEAVARRDSARDLAKRKRLTTEVESLERKLAELQE